MVDSAGSAQWYGDPGGRLRPPDNRQAAVWIAVVVVVAGLASAALLWSMSSDTEPAPAGEPAQQVSAAARNYIHTGAERGTEAAMALTCRQIKASWDASSPAQRANVDGVRAGTVVVAVHHVVINGDQATARVVVRTPGASEEQSRGLSFRREDGKWRPCGAAP